MLLLISVVCLFFFFNATATTEIYTLSLHDALPISLPQREIGGIKSRGPPQREMGSIESGALPQREMGRSEEHTSELQSPCNLVCRLLLEKKKKSEMKTTQSHVRMACLSSPLLCIFNYLNMCDRFT